MINEKYETNTRVNLQKMFEKFQSADLHNRLRIIMTKIIISPDLLCIYLKLYFGNFKIIFVCKQYIFSDISYFDYLLHDFSKINPFRIFAPINERGSSKCNLKSFEIPKDWCNEM